ncbi:MAG: translocation/assembly module TamB domain-containing protein [Acidobacteriaceae bacterium]
MSEEDLRKSESPESVAPADAPVRQRSVVLRIFGWSTASLAAIGIALVVAMTWYAGTPGFQQRLRGEVVTTLENATGGRVVVDQIHFSLWRLAVQADGLVIHGTEGPGEAPYLSVSKIVLRLQFNMVLTHIRGLGAQSRISLRYLRVEQPRFHLIVYPDGHTNAPAPNHPRRLSQPLTDTLLDLQAHRVELVHGMVMLNDRTLPINLNARDVNAQITYLRDTDRYGATIDLADLQARMASQPKVQSRLHLSAEMGRDTAAISRLEFWSGAADGQSAKPASKGEDTGTTATHLVAHAELTHFARPLWKGAVFGSVGVRQLSYLADVEGLTGGTLDLNLSGHNCVAAQIAMSAREHRLRLWSARSGKRGSKSIAPPSAETSGCTQAFVVVGSVTIHKVGFRDEYVRLHDIDGGAQLRITPQNLHFTDASAFLPGGGAAKGELTIDHWLGGNTLADRSHAFLTATVDHIPLRSVMDIVGPEHYGDLGFDTSITGPATVEWGGPRWTDISDTVQVESRLTFAPVGLRRVGVASNVPVSGEVIGHYDGRLEVVNLTRLAVQTPSSSLLTSGVLGVNVGDPLTNLQTNFHTHDLGEFDQLLHALDFEANGKEGVQAIPLILHGDASFTGTARGTVSNLELRGHADASHVVLRSSDMNAGMADVLIDSVTGSGEFSPNGGLTLVSSTIRRGDSVLNVSGSFKPQREVLHGKPAYPWNKDLAVDATVKLVHGQAADLLQIVGAQKRIPVTGTVNLDLSASGSMRDIIGGGSVTLTHGVAYGESYQKIAVRIAAEGQQVTLTQVLLQAHGLSIAGSVGYNLRTKQIRGEVNGNKLLLSRLDTMRRVGPNVDGVLSFTAIASGTLEQPDLHARLSLDQISLNGRRLGGLSAKADSTGSTLHYELNSTLAGAQVNAAGQTSLLEGYQTQAKLTMSRLDLANVIALLAPGSLKGSSAIDGTMSLSGPAATPALMRGSAEFDHVDFKLQGVELRAAQPLRASLSNGVLRLDQLYITGQDTDLRASGAAVVFGDPNPQGGRISLNADGSVSMGLAETFDPDLMSSGKVIFKVAAGGRLKKPTVVGDVAFKSVNLALDGVANGLSNMNGSLVFDQDRLDVKDLTATTGGGQLKIGGSLTYQNGLFAELTATGDVVRVRYDGLSATANARFLLQGTPQSMLLSGDVLMTRFGVGQDVDFSAFSAMGGVQAPSNPNSAANKIRLDVHITSSQQLQFQNSFAELAGSVNLTLRGTLASPSLLGSIQITDGSATYLGTKYELERGLIDFTNPVRIDPTIDLDASARVESYDITVGVHGTVTNLKPTYRSEPPLTEADIFDLLALGRTQEEAQLNQEQVGTATNATSNALLGGALNATVESRVGKLFGAGSVKIDPAFIGTLGNSSARITVTEPLSPQVTLVFATNINETAQQLIQVQYQLNEEYAIVATRDENDVFSLVLKLRKRYR